MKNFDKETASAFVEEFGTPVLIMSLEEIKNNYLFLQSNLPGVKLFYAIKSNPDKNIITVLDNLGSNFDVASDGEMEQLHQMGISPERMIYANPVKTPNGLKTANKVGVNRFTFDSETEIAKIAKAVPGGTVLLRIRVDSDAIIDLNKKFGAEPKNAMNLLRKARNAGLDVAGLCFHVGSNCSGPKSYVNALISCHSIFQEAKAEGFNMRILDIGGGFTHSQNTAELLGVVSVCLQGYFPDTEIFAEPGRFICETSMTLITSVIGDTVRNNQTWYWLDDGVYGVFSAIAADHWDPVFLTYKEGKDIYATFAGPSCDSMDIIQRDKTTPELVVGDIVVVPNAGAYTIVTATNFNGFNIPKIVVLK